MMNVITDIDNSLVSKLIDQNDVNTSTEGTENSSVDEPKMNLESIITPTNDIYHSQALSNNFDQLLVSYDGPRDINPYGHLDISTNYETQYLDNISAQSLAYCLPFDSIPTQPSLENSSTTVLNHSNENAITEAKSSQPKAVRSKLPMSLGQNKDDNWDEKYSALLDYGKEFGSYNVPQKYKCVLPSGDQFSLGKWLYTQRAEKKKGNIREDRDKKMQILADQGKLEWDSLGENRKWQVRFNTLIEYAHKNLHCTLPRNEEFTLIDGSKCILYNWLNNELAAKRKGKLKPDREEKFQQHLVNPGYLQWTKKHDIDEALWNSKYQALLAYANTHNGSYNVPENFKFIDEQGNDVRLGQWLSFQRAERRKGVLRADRLEKLNALTAHGFLWNLYGSKYENNNWDRHYEALFVYEQEYGTCNVVNSYKYQYDGKLIKLGRWLGKQRRAKRLGALAPDRLERLQKLVDEKRLLWEFSRMEYNKQTWEEKFNILRAYGNRHGTCELPRNAIIITTNELGRTKETRLGNWLMLQKASKKRGTLKADRIAKLQTLVSDGKLSWDLEVDPIHHHLFFTISSQQIVEQIEPETQQHDNGEQAIASNQSAINGESQISDAIDGDGATHKDEGIIAHNECNQPSNEHEPENDRSQNMDLHFPSSDFNSIDRNTAGISDSSHQISTGNIFSYRLGDDNIDMDDSDSDSDDDDDLYDQDAIEYYDSSIKYPSSTINAVVYGSPPPLVPNSSNYQNSSYRSDVADTAFDSFSAIGNTKQVNIHTSYDQKNSSSDVFNLHPMDTLNNDSSYEISSVSVSTHDIPVATFDGSIINSTSFPNLPNGSHSFSSHNDMMADIGHVLSESIMTDIQDIHTQNIGPSETSLSPHTSSQSLSAENDMASNASRTKRKRIS